MVKKMTRIDNLINELKRVKEIGLTTCEHGGISFSSKWMIKTQELAEKKGIIRKCNECSDRYHNYLIIL